MTESLYPPKMCGIAGIVHPERKGEIDRKTLERMNHSLRHRGPDEEGYWVGERAGLAMRRLSIIDLEGGRQPISNETGSVWTVFNGEIYNFQELRSFLIGKGHHFRSRSDTEVIVHLYEEEGENFVRRLRGMFAIALWDTSAERLLLYRDRVGIKPLHYWFRDGTLVFGSEIKALLEYPEVGREISHSALSDYLSYLYIPSPQTIYREIFKLPPGHFLRLEKGEMEIRPYWDFSYRENGRKLSEAEWAERLGAALKDAVQSHLVSDVPLGAFLSGGMDSSTVVAWMSEGRRAPVKTYSIGFRDERFNELPYAREVARCFGTDHHEAVVEADAFELLPKILSGFDEPFADASAIPTYLVSEFARREVKVALSGDGGDELFSGYLWTRKEAWLEQYRRLPFSLRRAAERVFLDKDYRPLRETSFVSQIQRFLYDAKLSPRESFSRRSVSFQPWMKRSLLRPEMEEALERESEEILRTFYERDAAQAVMEKLLYLNSKVYLPDDLLTKIDRMSMLHSLEVRVPLLDHELIELVSSIPFSMKLRGRTTKYILKQTMKNRLPRKVLGQRKQGFQVPLGRWFRGELGALARNLLLSEDSFTRPYFRLDYVDWILREHAAGRQRFETQIYALVVLELWGRLKEESRGSASSAVSLRELVK